MAVYFFHITEGTELTRDEEGLDRPDLNALRLEAVKAASDLIAEAIRKGECDYRGRLDVDDERGDRVLTLTFASPIHIEVAPPWTNDG